MKKVLLCLIFATMIKNVSAASSGECGINCSYTLDDDGLLTIYPTVEGDASINNRMFRTFGSFPDSQKIKSVNILPGITNIPSQAFGGCRNMTNIQIPNTVTSIGFGSLMTNIKQIVIPPSVTYISRDAFHTANELKEMIISSENADKIQFVAEEGTWRSVNFGTVVCKNCSLEQAQSLKGKLDSIVASPGIVQIYENDDIGNTLIKDLNGNYIGGFNSSGNKLDIDSQGRITAYYDANNVLVLSYAYGNDGSVSTYDKNGKLIGLQGKRILTVEEASALVKDNKNTFKLKYR